MKDNFKIIFVSYLFCTLITTKCLIAQPVDSLHYIKKEVMTPMRDGILLFSRIYTPVGQTRPLPVILMRSPYADWNMGLISPERDSYVADLAQDGYIFVYQNIRGKQKSEGKFSMEAPFDKADNLNINEASDTYDLIEWLLKNLNTNGRIGQLGISYPGELALISAAKPHPAIKAVSPQGTVADFFLQDDYFHNGAFRLSFSFEYAYAEESYKNDTNFNFGQYDLFDWYLKLGPLSNANKKHFKKRLPTWNEFVKHPNYDNYWKDKAPINFSDTPKIPCLHVGGYWDQENMNGPQALYGKMEKFDMRNYNYLVLGPWCHGQWSDTNATFLGDYEMGRNTANDFKKIQKQWFDYWLKDIGNGNFPEATCFQTGSNQWLNYDKWPPKNINYSNIYLKSDKELSFHKPKQSSTGFDTYISDPTNPVVYRQRPIQLTYSDVSEWETWLTEDQRFVESRPDVLSYKTDTLTEDLTITGEIIAHVFASTTGTDADWVVKLIDVYPNMYNRSLKMSQFELIIAADIFRGRFRNSFESPQPIEPNKINEYKFSLNQVNHVFKKGHRLMVQIQSTWFPLYDRNPQKFVTNIFYAKPEDFITSIQTIYRSGVNASYLELPIVENKKRGD